ncbi:hypothetical protein ACFQDJ_13285 [Pseudomonas brassicacearum]
MAVMALVAVSIDPAAIAFMVSATSFFWSNWDFMVVIAAEVASICCMAAVEAAREAPPKLIVVSPGCGMARRS